MPASEMQPDRHQGAPSPRSLEVRLRRRVERAVEALGAWAVRSGVDRFAGRLARPLAVAHEPGASRFVVVLSGGIRSTGELNATTRARVHSAVALLRSGRGETLIVSGGPRRLGRPSAAPAMRALAESLGVAPARILVEGRSSCTAENAREVASLVTACGERSVVLVTSTLHMRRAKLCFERRGVTVAAAPVAHVPGEPPVRASVLAQTLHEYLGLAYYRTAGWI